MFYTKTASAINLFFLASFLFSCNQKGNNPVDQNNNLRIQTSVNDSVFFPPDKSPMDMIYFPVNYPKEKMFSSNMAIPKVRVIYSRPKMNGRIIFADSTVTQNYIQHYGKEWRLGANEATEIEFFTDVTINGQKLSQGRYIIYCIPYSYKWVIFFNDNLFSWGLQFDKTKDVMKIELPVIKNSTSVEYLSMVFQEASYGCNLVFAWGDNIVRMPVNFN